MLGQNVRALMLRDKPVAMFRFSTGGALLGFPM